ncbi:hypothetical protein SERLA73DRAFT_176741 [Serpula lacrymans var. lacrymans S7.3]|uniref:WW domain-containing protein n=1 Tax=Serpula lacrymans var. lacrymans (strain S7.3) TaxID=936435 RepID=F8PPU7_SERL3|nr:hypothetical protein SERLA73DRAFT_176741 [Serpula lacrymans var. lacrymans S7.3]
MASPPPYSGSGPNPRELPPGWTSQWDSNYNAWFYVNTRENPPRSSWVHPYATAPSRSPPPQQFAPAMGAPPNREFNRSPYGEYNQGGWQNQPPQQYGGGPPGGYGTGYQPSYGGPPGGGYGGPQGEYRGNPGGYGGPMGGYPQEQERGFFGGGQSRPTYQQQPPAPPKKSGPGMGTALLAGGAGLVGGALLMDAFEDHNEDEREEGYDQGFQDGADDYGGGGYDDNGGDNW